MRSSPEAAHGSALTDASWLPGRCTSSLASVRNRAVLEHVAHDLQLVASLPAPSLVPSSLDIMIVASLACYFMCA
jgi:hypothetical protein